jgi:outer membrane protein assembly factor BamB
MHRAFRASTGYTFGEIAHIIPSMGESDRRRSNRGLTILLVLTLAVACGDGDGPTGPEPDPRLIWQVSLGSYDEGVGFYYGSPALSTDESTVYIGTSGPMMTSSIGGFGVHAFDAETGTERWVYDLDTLEVRSSPAVATDGAVLFVATSRPLYGGALPTDWLYCLSSGGNLQWRYQIGAGTPDSYVGYSAPGIGADGTVYVAADSLYAISPAGSVRWTASIFTNERLRNSPSVGPDGRVYFAFHNVPLTALDPLDGSPIWQQPLQVNDYCFPSPTVTPDGHLYIGNDEGVFYAFDTSGNPQWSYDLSLDLSLPGQFRSSASVDVDGTIYVGTKLNDAVSGLVALQSDGARKWFFQPDDAPEGFPPNHGDIYSSPAIGADGTIFIAHEMGRLYAVDSADGSLKWKFETRHGFTWSSPAIRSDGTLYVGDLDGNLYALRTDCGGLKTAAPWPRFRRDNQNTGRSLP